MNGTPPPSPDKTRGVARLPRAAFVAGLILLVLLIYGRNLDDGYLADDFLYLTWLDEGLGTLFDRVTIDSYPRMLRPIPALFWLVSRVPAGSVLQHLLSLGLHVATALLVARLATRTSGRPAFGVACGFLFLAFPFFAEPVLWLSASPDLWACLFALLALEIGVRAGTRPLLAGGALFALSLMSKESTLLLPLVIPLLFGLDRRVRRLTGLLLAISCVYFLVRLAVHGGLGGYLDSAGAAVALQVDPLWFVRNVTLQFPFRLLVPFKRAGSLFLPLAGLSALLLLGLAASLRLRLTRKNLIAPLLGFFVALLPVAAIFSVDFDHENTRMLYFPVALLPSLLGPIVHRPRPAAPMFLVGLVVLWSSASYYNARPWSEGSREIEKVLQFLEEHESAYPPHARVYVAGHDTWRGAYVWRTAIPASMHWAGLRDDLDWWLGTVALEPDRRAIGRTVFEVGPDRRGRVRDWTACEQALSSRNLPLLARTTLIPTSSSRLEGWLELETEIDGAVALALGDESSASPIRGRLHWREPPPWIRFNITDSRRFLLPAGARALMRVDLGQTQRVAVRVAPEEGQPLPERLELAAHSLPTPCH